MNHRKNVLFIAMLGIGAVAAGLVPITPTSSK
jgi:hypothetical protein